MCTVRWCDYFSLGFPMQNCFLPQSFPLVKLQPPGIFPIFLRVQQGVQVTAACAVQRNETLALTCQLRQGCWPAGLDTQAPVGVAAQADISHANNEGFRQGNVPADVNVGKLHPVLSRSWIPREAGPYLIFFCTFTPLKKPSEFFSLLSS